MVGALNIPRGETNGFKRFTLKVRALVGILDQLGDNGQIDFHCGSHVTRLQSKLPQDMQAQFKRFLYHMHVTIPSLLHFSDWLSNELQIQETVYEFLFIRTSWFCMALQCLSPYPQPISKRSSSRYIIHC